MERRQSEFLQRAEQAEADLAASRQAPPAIPEGSLAVPLSTLPPYDPGDSRYPLFGRKAAAAVMDVR